MGSIAPRGAAIVCAACATGKRLSPDEELQPVRQRRQAVLRLLAPAQDVVHGIPELGRDLVIPRAGQRRWPRDRAGEGRTQLLELRDGVHELGVVVEAV